MALGHHAYLKSHRRLKEGVKLLVPNIGPQCIFQETAAEPTRLLVSVWQWPGCAAVQSLLSRGHATWKSNHGIHARESGNLGQGRAKTSEGRGSIKDAF